MMVLEKSTHMVLEEFLLQRANQPHQRLHRHFARARKGLHPKRDLVVGMLKNKQTLFTAQQMPFESMIDQSTKALHRGVNGSNVWRNEFVWDCTRRIG